MFNFMTPAEHFCSLSLWSYRIHVFFPNYFPKHLFFEFTQYLNIWHQFWKRSYKFTGYAVVKVFDTGGFRCFLCAFKGASNGSNCTGSINGLFKKTLERSRVIKVGSLARVVFNSSIIKASLKCHPLFISSIKCLTSMMWFLIKTLLKWAYNILGENN